jgi:hypothetical protein
MTIFLSMTRELLIKNIELSKARMDADDKSFVGFFRLKELSDSKKELASAFIEVLRSMSEQENDLLTKELILKEILKVQACVYSKCEQVGQSSGKFAQELTNLIVLVERIFSKFKECGLLDLNKTMDPLDVFSFYAGQYISQKVDLSVNQSYLSYLTSHPQVSSFWRLTIKKEALLETKIRECREAVGALNKDHPRFKEHYQLRVINFIDEVIRENEEYCREHSTAVGLPLITFNFFSVLSASSNVQPKSGMLHGSMEKAKQEIKQLKIEEIEIHAATP